MRIFLLLPFLLTPLPPFQNAPGASDGSPMNVVGYKWTKLRQVVEKPDTQGSAPAPAMIPANRNFERNRRVNDPAGVRDPNADTIDGRSAALDKAVRESRSPKTVEVDGFAYKVKVQNAGQKVAEIVFFEYQFTETAAPANMTRRQFLCGVNIKPGKEKELLAFSLSGPSDVISVGSLSARDAALFQEKVLINRVEYSDGSIWQRKGWDFAEIKAAYNRAVGTPWDPAEMCRGL